MVSIRLRLKIADMDTEIVDLDGLIQNTRSSEEYQKIENIAKEKVNAILTDKKAILAMAMASVIEAIRTDHNKEQLSFQHQVSTFGYFNPSSFNNNDISTTIITPTTQESNYYNHLLFPIEKLQKLAEGFYDKLSRMCVNNTMKAVIHDSQNLYFSHSFAFDA
jgi:hypothetical protein